MQKPHSFLPGVKSKLWIFAVLYCIVVVALVYGTDSAQAEKKTTSIVYAQGKTLAASATAQEETQYNKQIQQNEEIANPIDESAEAMQQELAKGIAAAEKAKRKKQEEEEKKIRISDSDKKILWRIVEAEATGEDIEGKMLVANVVLNRVNNDEFPNTIEKVVFAHKQFSPIRDGRYYKVSITEETKEAVERVLSGEDKSNGAVYFMSRKKANKRNVTWFDNKLTKVAEHGTHEFYK